MTRLRIAWLPDGKRLRLSDGVIDVILQAFGRPGDISRAYDAAIARTQRILNEFDAELPRLSQGVYSGALLGERVNAAVALFGAYAVPPESAVAGAVADDVMAAMLKTAPLDRGFVNNCGRIAFHIAPGQSLPVAMMDRPGGKDLLDKVVITSTAIARGMATLARHWGRCAGVADALMVAAVTAAAADVAGEMIAAATDVPGAARAEALPLAEKRAALASGIAFAEKLQNERLIRAAIVTVQGEEAELYTERMRQQLAET